MPINDDAIVEAAEAFSVGLSTGTPLAGRSVDTTDAGTGTITDNDTATFSIDDVTVNEGDGTLTFTVATDKALDIAVEIDVVLSDLTTTADDFDHAAITANFAAGVTSQTVTVAIADDMIVEATESFTARLGTSTELSGRNVDITDTGAGTITDNDTAAFSIDDVTVNEADGTLTFTVTTDKPSDIPIDIDVAFTNVSTLAGDFTPTSATVNFAAGATTQTVSVSVTEDEVVEATETFTASLSTATPLGGRGVDTTDTGTGTITDNDTAAFTIDDVTVNEADGALTFTLVTDKTLDIPVVILVTPGDVSTTAGDFDHAAVAASFAAGATSQTVTLTITDDLVVEATETFTASLSTDTPLNGRRVDTTDTGIGAITDDDTAVFSITDMTVREDDGVLTFAITTDKPLDIAIDIDVVYGNESTATGDFDNTADTARFAAGETSQTVTVAVTDDEVVELTETFTARLSTGTALGGRSVDTSDTGIGSIVDNDTAEISIGNVALLEGNSGTTVFGFEVTLSHPVATDVSFDYVTQDGSAEDPLGDGDYQSTGGTLTFPANSTAPLTIQVAVVGDQAEEDDEVFSVVLSQLDSQGHAVSMARATGTGTIVNDDQNGMIRGTSWNDRDADGIHDPGEPYLNGRTIRLTDAEGNIRETTTQGNGSFEFSQVLPGTYTLSQVQQDGWTATFADEHTIVVDSSGQAIDGFSFGNYQGGSLSGTKWHDLNGDGMRQPNEPVLLGWTFELLDETGEVIDTATQGPQGQYIFSGLAPAVYSIREVAQPVWQQSFPQGASLPQSVRDLGLHFAGSFFENWGGTGEKWVRSEANGDWYFITPDGGLHALADGLPRDNQAVAMLDPSFHAQPRLLWSTANVHSVQLAGGEVYQNLDFGNYLPGFLSGREWEDENVNGLYDPGEQPLSGITIELQNDFGQVIAATTTRDDGSYEFHDLRPGNYSIQGTLPSGWAQSRPAAPPIASSQSQPAGYDISLRSGEAFGNLDFGSYLAWYSIQGQQWNDRDADGSWDADELPLAGVTVVLTDAAGNTIQTATTGANGDYIFENVQEGAYTIWEVIGDDWVQSYPSNGIHTVTAGPDLPAFDFGNYRTVTLAGQAWDDRNADGIQDVSEPTLAGLSVVLTDGDGIVAGTATTGSDGGYQFDDVGPGSYAVAVEIPNGWRQSSPGRSDSFVHAITVDGADVDDLDFGSYETFSIGGLKWNDLNGDGTRDAAEPLLAGVPIRLTGDGIVLETVTGPDGGYRFDDLDPGAYTIGEGLQQGWRQSFPQSNHEVVLAGADILHLDFGNYQYGSIDGFAWHDMDADGVWQPGEPALNSVSINLVGADGIPIRATQTSGIVPGYYSFEDVPLGDYRLEATNLLHPDWRLGQPGGGTYDVSLTVAQPDHNGLDFGYFPVSSIVGHKWDDLNADGVWDDDEPGLAGVTIQLIDAQAQVVQTTTGPDGSYEFPEVLPGTYTLAEVLTGAWQQSFPGPSGGFEHIVTVNSGNISGVDFGNFLPAQPNTIAGRKWHDTDADGQLDDGEWFMDGVRIELYDSDGRFVADRFTTTDQQGNSGSFRFDDLPSGSYFVYEDLWEGWHQSLPLGDDGVPLSIADDFDGTSAMPQGWQPLFDANDAVVVEANSTVTITNGAESGYVLSRLEPFSPQGRETTVTAQIAEMGGAADPMAIVGFGTQHADLSLDVIVVTVDGEGIVEVFTQSGDTEAGGYVGELSSYVGGPVEVSFTIDMHGYQISVSTDFETFQTDPLPYPGQFALSQLTDEASLLIGSDGINMPPGSTTWTTFEGVQLTSVAGRAGYEVQVDGGQGIDDLLFGSYQNGNIEGEVWLDANGDGLWNANEEIVGGVTVELVDAQTGNVLDTRRTAGLDFAEFDGSTGETTLLLPWTLQYVGEDGVELSFSTVETEFVFGPAMGMDTGTEIPLISPGGNLMPLPAGEPWRIDVSIPPLVLQGQSPDGAPTQVTLHGLPNDTDSPLVGQITAEYVDDAFVIDSFFDVLIEIAVSGGPTFTLAQPVRMTPDFPPGRSLEAVDVIMAGLVLHFEDFDNPLAFQPGPDGPHAVVLSGQPSFEGLDSAPGEFVFEDLKPGDYILRVQDNPDIAVTSPQYVASPVGGQGGFVLNGDILSYDVNFVGALQSGNQVTGIELTGESGTVIDLLVGGVSDHFEQIFVFGDDLSDVGNVSSATQGTAPAEPFVDGRFSDGPVWIDHLSDRLGLEITPAFEGGTNYAFGGAWAGDDIEGFLGNPIPGLETQVQEFSEQHGSADFGESLFVLSAGTNDLIALLESAGDLSPQQFDTAVDLTFDTAIGAITDSLSALIDLGASQLLVMTAPDLGLTPQFADQAEFASQLSAEFNQALYGAIYGPDATIPDGVWVDVFDVYSLFNVVAQDAVENQGEQFGIDNIDEPIFDPGFAGDPAASLFADSMHLSTAAHSILADALFLRWGHVGGSVALTSGEIEALDRGELDLTIRTLNDPQGLSDSVLKSSDRRIRLDSGFWDFADFGVRPSALPNPLEGLVDPALIDSVFADFS